MEVNRNHGESFDNLFREPVEIRLARAKDPRSSPNLLRMLARDEFWYVRDFVASNISTPRDSLENLLKDSDFRVRSEAERTIARLGERGSLGVADLENVIMAAEERKKKQLGIKDKAVQTVNKDVYL